jgi:hypothetical protein
MKIALIGDSHSKSWIPRLSPILEQQGHKIVFTSAHRGWGVKNYLNDAAFPSALKQARPDVVVVGLGGNNWLYRPSHQAKYQARLTAMVDILRGAGAQTIIWMGPAVALTDGQDDPNTPKNEKHLAQTRHEATANMQQDMLPALGVNWIDMRPATKTGHGGDGVHFKSYTKWVNYASPQVTGYVNAAPTKGFWLPPQVILPLVALGTVGLTSYAVKKIRS